jgi:hypothetical protein
LQFFGSKDHAQQVMQEVACKAGDHKSGLGSLMAKVAILQKISS